MTLRLIWRLALGISLAVAGLLSLASTGAWSFDPEMGAGDQQRAKRAYVFYMQAQQAEGIGDFPGAVKLYRQSIGQYPKIKEVHHALGKCLARTGATEEALASFRTALNIDYNFIECRNNYGEFLKSRNELKDAMLQFNQCIQIDPKYPFPYYNLGLMLHDKGDLDGAIANFESCTRLAPKFAPAFEELGMCVFERASQGDLREAIDQLMKARALLPDNPKIHYHLGIIYSTACQLDAAEAEFREALRCDAKMAAAHFELGKLRYFRGDLDRAMIELQHCETINPVYTDSQKYPQVDPIKVKTLIARDYEFSGELIKAIETYQQIAQMKRSDVMYMKHIQDLDKQIKQEIKDRKKKPLTYDPEEVDAYINKGIDQYEEGALDDARSSFDRAMELNPASFRACQNIAFVQDAQGDLNGAVATCQKAVALNPLYDGAVYNLAFMLEKMHLPDDAGRMYMRFRTLAPQYPYDPRHIVELQQDILRQQQKQEYIRKRGY